MKTSRHHAIDASGHEPGVLLVGENAESLKAMVELVRATLPLARIETLASTTELIFRLAADDVAIVVLIDSTDLRGLPPSLLGLTRPLSGRPRLALLGEPGAPAPAIALLDLPGWLRLAAAPRQTRPSAPSERLAGVSRPKVSSP